MGYPPLLSTQTEVNKHATRLAMAVGLLAAYSAQPAPSQERVLYDVIDAGSGRIAVPHGWRNFDVVDVHNLIFRSGDGIGAVPIVDETGEPLQIGLTVAVIEKADATVAELLGALVQEVKADGRFELLGPETLEEITLSDGTRARLLTVELIKEEQRRSVQMKLVLRDADSSAWIVSGFIVGGKESTWPVAGSSMAEWLKAHVTSFTPDGTKFDATKVEAAYRPR